MTSSSPSYVWKPSTARRVTLDAFIPVPRGSAPAAPPPLNWPTKDPADVLDYEFDISPALVGNEGDMIATLTINISPNAPGDLVLNSAAIDGAVAVLWLAGGQSGSVYTVTILITTTSGRTVQRSVLLPVLPLSQPPVPANAIQTSAGLVITDQNGNPVLTA